ncbi:MAG: hypothetical protein KBD37_00125 [Burkholderiales bacterium]|nr:hypothetical protein [Burkholderiales bacterium]
MVKLLCLGFILMLAYAFANPISSNSKSTTNSSTLNDGIGKTANLDGADNDANDLIKLKRQLDIEKAQADIKKLHNSTTSNKGPSSAVDSTNAQTTVTGVAIDQDGKKIAWLQFADGGSLTVNIGSQVGKYIVREINMSGVELSYYSGTQHRELHSLWLKRAYEGTEGVKIRQNTKNMPVFSPSPIVTNANGGDNDMVPPIIREK